MKHTTKKLHRTSGCKVASSLEQHVSTQLVKEVVDTVSGLRHNEQIIHAPAEASGWFRLEVDEKGNLYYWKVNA